MCDILNEPLRSADGNIVKFLESVRGGAFNGANCVLSKDYRDWVPDVVNETLVNCWKCLLKGQLIRDPEAFAFKVAKHRALVILPGLKRFAVRIIDDFDDDFDSGAWVVLVDHCSSAHALESQEDSSALSRLIAAIRSSVLTHTTPEEFQLLACLYIDRAGGGEIASGLDAAIPARVRKLWERTLDEVSPVVFARLKNDPFCAEYFQAILNDEGEFRNRLSRLFRPSRW
jgi:DNA-directed RNA polymerase specialized sigma24 family protein